MADTFRIKRRAVGGAAGAPATLAAAEIAYNEVDDTLYYGKGNNGSGVATSVLPVAGSGAFAPKASPVLTGTVTASYGGGNNLLIEGRPSAQNVWLYASGVDANVGIAYAAKAGGSHFFYTGSFSNIQVVILHQTTAGYLQIAGGDGNVNLSMSTAGDVTIANANLTGNARAPTPTAGDNDTSVATTAFVTAAVAAAGGGGSVFGFSAYASGAQTISSETQTKILFATANFDIGSYFNTSNSRWTPPAGLHRMSATVMFSDGLLPGTPMRLELWKNGTQFKFMGYSTAPANYGAVVGTCIDNANGTDYYEVYIYIMTGASGAPLLATTTATFFQGHTL